MEFSPSGAGPSLRTSPQRCTRYCSKMLVSDSTASLFTTEKESMKDASTACGNRWTNFCEPRSGVGSAPARSVSQCTK
eukprot:scaffold115120_cov31-Tisochrysis_lutea.AAC.8